MRQLSRGTASVAFAVAALLPTLALSSNLGFRLSLALPANGPTGGLYWIAIPYTYTPPDVKVNGLLDAEDLAQDLQPTELARPCTDTTCAVAQVLRWDSTTGAFESWTAGSAGDPFVLEPGVGYAIQLRTVGTASAHMIHVVGAHDPTLELTGCHTPGGVNLRWISIPPHLDIDTSFGLPGVLDAEDLGQALGGPDHVFQLRRLNESTGQYDNWVVGSAYGTPFEVDLRFAYGVDLTCSDPDAPCGSCQWAWTAPEQ